MTYIYIDVLLILNLYVNYFLIKATARFLHAPLRQSRCIAAATIGSLYSLTILLPSMHWVVSTLGKLLLAAGIVRIAFGKCMRLRHIIAFFLISFGFSGGMLALSLWVRPQGMAVNNGNLYLNFSLVSLVLCTIAAYFLICALRWGVDKATTAEGRYTVMIRQSGKLISLEGIADTGNVLVDSFSGKAVIVCGRERLGKLMDLPQNLPDTDACIALASHLRGFRLIPYSTIACGGILPVFTPDEVVICEAGSKRHKRVDALIGVNHENTAAIFNPRLLI